MCEQKLQCLFCRDVSRLTEPLPVDHVLICARCGGASELRQLHEAWCESQRPNLYRRFPELAPLGNELLAFR